ncbi:MAG: hypothetical protein ACLUHE_06525 [Christensenellales bacterium]
MPEDWKRALERRLADVPRGEVLIRAASGAPLSRRPPVPVSGGTRRGGWISGRCTPGVELTPQA